MNPSVNYKHRWKVRLLYTIGKHQKTDGPGNSLIRKQKRRDEIIYTDTYTYIQRDRMGSKNISLKESAYERLSSLKKEDESFSDLVERLTEGKTPKYSDLAGILSEDTIEAIESTSGKRKRTDISEFEGVTERFEDDEE